MSELPTPQRRRRGQKDFNSTTASIELSSDEPSALQNIVEPEPEESSVESEPTFSTASKLAVIDRIRTEILEDQHHSQLVEPNYWDETHNWENNGELVSDEYWHFLGRYE